MAKGRITSITILPDFNNFLYDFWKNDWLLRTMVGTSPSVYLSQGLEGYPVDMLPEGLRLETDHKYVVVMGPNGSGKSTLLHKMGAQLSIGYKGGGKYLRMEYRPHDIKNDDRNELSIWSISPMQQPERFLRSVGSFRNNIMAEAMDEHSLRSSGQYKWDTLSSGFKQGWAPNVVLCLDQPEDDLDVVRAQEMVEAMIAYIEKDDRQMFVATNRPELLKPDGLVISLFPTKPSRHAEVFRTSDFDLDRHIKPLRRSQFSFHQKKQEGRSRITSIRIKPDFHRYTFKVPNPSKGEIEIEVINRYTPYAQGLDGYPVPPLPEDLVLPTDSPYVAIVGRNGSGKSTLLYKLFIQLMFGINETIGKYLDVKYTGKKPACRLIRGDDQPEPYLRSLEPKTDPERARLSRLSKGQYKWERLSRALSTDIPADTILFLDQPEDNLSIGNIRKLVGLLEGFLKQRGNQLFVATHCPELLGIDGLVINMLDWSRENPGGIASVCRTAEFDLSKYL